MAIGKFAVFCVVWATVALVALADESTYNMCKAALKASKDDLLQRPDVNAVAISHKTVNGENTYKMSITISVSKKIPESELSADRLLPWEIQGCITDVIERELVEPWGFRNKELDLKEEPSWFDTLIKKALMHWMYPNSEEAEVQGTPVQTLQGGDYIGPRSEQRTGTLGYFFEDNITNKRGVVTSAHVIPRKGNIVVSPSLPHSGTQTSTIGKATNRVITRHTDGAFVQLDDQLTQFSYKLKNGVKVTGTGRARINDRVMYYGAETGGVVTGEVISLNWSGKFQSGYTFDDQIEIKATQGTEGDSGSVLVRTSDDRALGVLMAVTRDPKTMQVTGSVHNDINNFETDLGITLLI